MGFVWTQERIDKLKALWDSGEKLPEICSAIGARQSVIAGKMRRLRRKGVEFADRTSDWTPERVQELQRLWLAGKSYSEIGTLLGVKRNAISGKVSRLRKEGVEFPERAPRSSTPRLTPRRKRNSAPPARPAPSARTEALSDGTGLPKHPPMMKQVPFEQTKRHECKYPLWGPDQKSGPCCGNLRVPGLPYCRAHQALCHEPMKRSRRRVA